MKIAIAINYVKYSNPEKKERQDAAISVLLKNSPKGSLLASFNYPEDDVRLPPVFRIFKMLQKDSQKELGNDRRMPYIKEILDSCSNLPYDIFGYMNSDILLTKNFFDIFRSSYDVFLFFKKDIVKVSATDFLNNKIKIIDEKPDGIDAIFFRTKWWKANRGLFPDGLILGETEWDTAYNSIIQKSHHKYVLSRTLYHPYHERVWRIDSRGAIHNTLIWQTVRQKCGLPKSPEEIKK